MKENQHPQAEQATEQKAETLKERHKRFTDAVAVAAKDAGLEQYVVAGKFSEQEVKNDPDDYMGATEGTFDPIWFSYICKTTLEMFPEPFKTVAINQLFDYFFKQPEPASFKNQPRAEA